ncbi:MAG TPA: selenium metabolism-associated LysR family transcriptional regulator [Desulfomonilaceae bacterium]|nr:selenium metabolism-associated LysR family transcriptional regulator [Desulfomonilaceae bacterium]
MEMRRLEVFCKVVELRSFTRAAEALSLSQPTVSEHIRTLEDGLGEKLVDRLGREVRPTPAGRIFYQYARNIVQMRDEALQALEHFKGNLAGTLVLGASTIPGTYLLPKLIGSFKNAHPAIQITLRISDTANIVEEVLETTLEAGIVGSSLTDRRLTLEEVGSDELVLVVYPGHSWAARGRIPVTELAEEPFILRERGSGTRMVMTKVLETYGFDPSTLPMVAEMGSTEAVRQGVKARIGVSILSRQAVEDDITHGTLVPVTIDGLRLSRPLYLIQRKKRQISPVCAAFLEYLRSRTYRASQK